MHQSVKEQYAKGISGRTIAKKLNVSHETVYKIIRDNGYKKENRPDLSTMDLTRPLRQLAKETGYSATTIWRYRNDRD